MRYFQCLCFALFLSFGLSAQDQGAWHTFYSYSNISELQAMDKHVLAVAEHALFFLDTEDHSVSKFTSADGLTGESITAIAADETSGLLVIAYEDGELQLLDNDGLFSEKGLLRSSVTGSKSISDIHLYDGILYLSCEFGIVAYDVLRREFKDTYYTNSGMQNTVFQTSVYEDDLYAATENGLYRHDLNDQGILNFANWELLSNPLPCQAVEVHDGNLYYVENYPTSNDRVYRKNGASTDLFYDGTSVITNILSTSEGLSLSGPSKALAFTPEGNKQRSGANFSDAIFLNGKLWVASLKEGLIENESSEVVSPNGPKTNTVFSLGLANQELWVATGHRDGGWGDRYLNLGVYYRRNGFWEHISGSAMGNLHDPTQIIGVPNSDKVYVVCCGEGLSRLENYELEIRYNESNSAVEAVNTPWGKRYRGGGGMMDEDGNFWFSNYEVGHQIKVLTPGDEWYAYSVTPEFSDSRLRIGQMTANSYGEKFFITRSSGVIVFDEGEDLTDVTDFESGALTTFHGLPTNEIESIAADKNDMVWIGTRAGLRVYNSRGRYFEDNSPRVDSVIINEDGFVKPLMGSQWINAIAVDGANRKWIGTANNGVYQVSASGREILLHLTKANSPLPSNSIKDVVIDHQNGRVYIGTGRGTVAMDGDATEGREDFSEVLAYPNPVRPGYDGDIKVKGLPDGSNVKIIDIEGNLVHETTSEGGTIIWDGSALGAHPVGSGVYLVMMKDKEGRMKHATKILIVR